MSKVLTVILSTSALLSIGCNFDGRDIDPRLEPYVLEFEEEFGVYVDFPVLVADFDKPPHVAGHCSHTFPNPTIKIRPQIFELFEEYPEQLPLALRRTIYHELGHCVMGLGHDDTMVNVEGVETAYSFMNSNKTSYEGGILNKFGILSLQHYTDDLRHKYKCELQKPYNDNVLGEICD